MNDLEGKVAVITGAASGIGLGMATRFAEAGMKVVMADIERPVLDKAVAALKDSEHDVVGVDADVSQRESVEELAREAIRHYGAVHVLCNNAGVAGGAIGSIWELPQDDWDWVYGVNFWGVLHGLRTFVPVMLEQGDECHIVNTASMAGLTPGGSIYGATKTGVVNISETLISQLKNAEANIGVSVLCPGFVRTEIMSSSRNRPGDFKLKDARSIEDLPEEIRPLARVFNNAIQTGKEPLEVGTIVLDAIKQNRFYVLTDDVWNDAIEMRPGYVLAGTPPTLGKESLRMREELMNSDE